VDWLSREGVERVSFSPSRDLNYKLGLKEEEEELPKSALSVKLGLSSNRVLARRTKKKERRILFRRE